MSAQLAANGNGRIAAALERVYRDAGLNAFAIRPGVVPLYELISAYPLRVAEVRKLTYGSARDFLVAETQQDVPVPDNSDGQLAGYLYLYGYAGTFYGCVLLEQRDPVARRRFSAAHELGHYLLHFLPLLEQPEASVAAACVITEGLPVVEDPDAAPPAGQLQITEPISAVTHEPILAREAMEMEANQFAAELLMPETAVRLLADRHQRETGGRRRVLARRLAPEFLVSRQAMERRLVALCLPGAPSTSRGNRSGMP